MRFSLRELYTLGINVHNVLIATKYKPVSSWLNIWDTPTSKLYFQLYGKHPINSMGVALITMSAPFSTACQVTINYLLLFIIQKQKNICVYQLKVWSYSPSPCIYLYHFLFLSVCSLLSLCLPLSLSSCIMPTCASRHGPWHQKSESSPFSGFLLCTVDSVLLLTRPRAYIACEH